MYFKCPIILVNPSATSLTSAQRAVVSKVSKVIALGGTSSVSDELLADAEWHCPKRYSLRLGGTDRYATSATIVEWELRQGMLLEAAGFATGEAFPDALASSYLLGCRVSILGLVSPSGPNSQMMATIQSAAAAEGKPASIRIFGGNASVPDAVRAQIATAVGWNDWDISTE